MSATLMLKENYGMKQATSIFALCSALLLIGSYSTLMDMFTIWMNSDTYNHCFLIFPISAYLIYSERESLVGIPVGLDLRGGLLFIAAAFIWLCANLVDVKLFEQGALVLMIQSLVIACFGMQLSRKIWFPLFFLFFAVPFGSELVPALRDITAVFSVEMLKLTGIPVFLDSRYISIPTGNFFVAEACSGINYLIASFTLGVLYAYYQYQSVYRRALFVVLSLIVPVIANGIRAYGIIMIAHLSDHKYATGVDHIIYGWIWFGVVLFLLFAIGRTFAEKPNKDSDDGEQSETTSLSAGKGSSSFVIGTVVIGFLIVAAVVPIHSKMNAPLVDVNWEQLNQEGWQPQTSLLKGKYTGARKEISFGKSIEYKPWAIDVYQYAGLNQAEIFSSINSEFDKEEWRELERRSSPYGVWTRVQNNREQTVWLLTVQYLRGKQVVGRLNAMTTDLYQQLTATENNSFVVVIAVENSELSQVEDKAYRVLKQFEKDIL
ncbi:exosortase A [Pleionea sp. CnH1-48]|uniref:exosortase A n=1 Tax=Pleionea sp. CnH1-48 TaxID=2954494 RepID=UPI0020968F39|nr:exosortase A [Pleionea sp. CnH1-48]MCO7226250.1 exosortase A [Pleionea sp. CnH1-48]